MDEDAPWIVSVNAGQSDRHSELDSANKRGCTRHDFASVSPHPPLMMVAPFSIFARLGPPCKEHRVSSKIAHNPRMVFLCIAEKPNDSELRLPRYLPLLNSPILAVWVSCWLCHWLWARKRWWGTDCYPKCVWPQSDCHENKTSIQWTPVKFIWAKGKNFWSKMIFEQKQIRKMHKSCIINE